MIGQQTFIFWSKNLDAPRDRKNIEQETYTPTIVPGCLLQPQTVTARGTNIDYELATFQLISHPFPAALELKSADLVQDASTKTVYRVIGTIVYPGPNNVPHHVVIDLVTPSGLDEIYQAPESPELISGEQVP